GRAFFHGPDGAVEFKMPQIVQKALGKTALAGQVFDVALGKMQVVDHLAELLQPRRNGKAALVGNLAEEHIEYADFVGVSFLKVSRGHGQLVEIHQKGQVAFLVDVGHKKSRLSVSVYFTARGRASHVA